MTSRTKPETALSKRIAAAVELLGGKVIRVQSGEHRVRGGYLQCADPGTPDRLVLLPGGRSLWLEVKLDDGRVSPEQMRWHAEAVALGHRVAVVRSVAEAVEACREVAK